MDESLLHRIDQLLSGVPDLPYGHGRAWIQEACAVFRDALSIPRQDALPREPTEAMTAAGNEMIDRYLVGEQIEADVIWRVMYDAAIAAQPEKHSAEGSTEASATDKPGAPKP